MKKYAYLLHALLISGGLTMLGCGSSNNTDANNSYRDTVTAPTTDDNNMRNDQPTDELTKPDSLADTVMHDTL